MLRTAVGIFVEELLFPMVDTGFGYPFVVELVLQARRHLIGVVVDSVPVGHNVCRAGKVWQLVSCVGWQA